MTTTQRSGQHAFRRFGHLLLLFVLLPILLRPSVASAHALLERADPTPEAVLPSSPARVRLWFSEDLNGSASEIIVWNRHRQNQTTADASLAPGQARELEVPLHALAPGAYLVLWTSVSATDGHILRGSYLFYVRVRGPGPSLTGIDQGGSGQSFPDLPGLVSLLAHWVELLSAVVWAGAEGVALLVLPAVGGRLDSATVLQEEHRRRMLVRGSLLSLLLSSAILLLFQAYALAGDWSSTLSGSIWSGVFANQYGHLWLGRQAIVLLAFLATIAGRSPVAISPTLTAKTVMSTVGADSWSAAVLATIYLFLFAAGGHGASAAIGTLGNSDLISVSVAMDWLHFLADALWFGGQAYLALVVLPLLRPSDSTLSLGGLLEFLKRFSPVAYASVALYSVSGFFNAKIHIPSWYAFFNSVYGKTLIIKIVLIALMMGISVLTVYSLRPRIKRGVEATDGQLTDRLSTMVKGLLFCLRLSPVMGVGVLLATSVLFYYPVPFNFSPPGPSSYSLTRDGLTAEVALSPDRSGPNQLVIRLTDRQHRPVTQAHITVLSTMLDMVMGTGIAPLRETSPGTFSGTTELGMGGHWRLELLIYSPVLSAGYSRPSVRITVGT